MGLTFIFPPSWYPGLAIVLIGVPLGMAKGLALATRTWRSPLSFKEAAALLVPILPLTMATMFSPLAGSLLFFGAIIGGSTLVARRRSEGRADAGKATAMVWFLTLAVTGAVPWLAAGAEEDLVWHPLFICAHLVPLFFAAVVTRRMHEEARA